jgi:hypothetical protein
MLSAPAPPFTVWPKALEAEAGAVVGVAALVGDAAGRRAGVNLRIGACAAAIDEKAARLDMVKGIQVGWNGGKEDGRPPCNRSEICHGLHPVDGSGTNKAPSNRGDL